MCVGDVRVVCVRASAGKGCKRVRDTQDPVRKATPTHCSMSANRRRFFRQMASAPSVVSVMTVGTNVARIAAGVALRGSCTIAPCVRGGEGTGREDRVKGGGYNWQPHVIGGQRGHTADEGDPTTA